MALNNKLIDGLGGLDEAISKAKELTGLKTSNPEIIFHKDKRSLDKILEMLSYSPLQNFTKVSSSVQLSYTVE
jgi:ClpP class serine protease